MTTVPVAAGPLSMSLAMPAWCRLASAPLPHATLVALAAAHRAAAGLVVVNPAAGHELAAAVIAAETAQIAKDALGWALTWGPNTTAANLVVAAAAGDPRYARLAWMHPDLPADVLDRAPDERSPVVLLAALANPTVPLEVARATLQRLARTPEPRTYSSPDRSEALRQLVELHPALADVVARSGPSGALVVARRPGGLAIADRNTHGSGQVQYLRRLAEDVGDAHDPLLTAARTDPDTARRAIGGCGRPDVLAAALHCFGVQVRGVTPFVAGRSSDGHTVAPSLARDPFGRRAMATTHPVVRDPGWAPLHDMMYCVPAFTVDSLRAAQADVALRHGAPAMLAEAVGALDAEVAQTLGCIADGWPGSLEQLVATAQVLASR